MKNLNRIIELLRKSLDLAENDSNVLISEWNEGYITGLKHAQSIIVLVTGKEEAMFDTQTNYGYINIEKNGKRGGIIL